MKDACVTQRGGEPVQRWCLPFLLPPFCTAPTAFVQSAAEKKPPTPRNHHLSLFTCDAISPQHRAFLTHDHLRGRDDAMYLLWGIDRLKVTVANAFNSVVLHPRWLTQEKVGLSALASRHSSSLFDLLQNERALVRKTPFEICLKF